MRRIFWEKLRSYKIVVVAHESSKNGPPQELREFLISKRVKNLLFIAHPLIYLKEYYKDSSRYATYREGKQVNSYVAFHWKLPEPFLYAKDVLYTLLWCLQSKDPFDIFFGADPLNAFSGIILRKLGKVKKVVYYSIDYTPKRFDNPILNYAYHLIDRVSCSMANLNWIGTYRTVGARIASGISKRNMAKIIVVPDGTHTLLIKKKNISQIHMYTLVYVGFIMEKQGIDLVIDSLPEIKHKIPDVKFIVVGKGPYLPELERKVARLGLMEIVEFKGFIADDTELQDILTGCAVGVAPYVEDKNSFTYYSPAGKPVLYLGCGLPVIITDVPPIARDIHKRKAGIMIHYKKDQFIDAVLTLLRSKKEYNIYKQNATRFGEELDWSDIFEKGVRKTITAFKEHAI